MGVMIGKGEGAVLGWILGISL